MQNNPFRFATAPYQPIPSHAGPSQQAAQMPAPDKYINVNGVKKINPAHKQWQKTQNATTAVNDPDRTPTVIANYSQPNALAIVSTPEDFAAAQMITHGPNRSAYQPAESVRATEEIMAEEARTFGVQGLDGEELLTGLYENFAKYQVPRGYINKLATLIDFRNEQHPEKEGMHFLIDDSTSMNGRSDVRDDGGAMMSRFQEAEQRHKTFMEFLAFIPTGKIKLSFLNRSDVIELNRPAGQSPDAFCEEANNKISAAFSRQPNGWTPIAERLKPLVNNGGKMAIYLSFDGRPEDGYGNSARLIGEIQNMVLNRPNPQNTPITFLSCTDQDKEVDWAKKLEEVAPFVAEYDDFSSESKEIKHDQGEAMPFSPGMWIVSQLVGAMHPNDLDAMDESVPLTRHTLENMLGATLSNEEYKTYFQHFERSPASPWKHMFAQFNVNEQNNPTGGPLVASDMPAVQHHKAIEHQKLTQEINHSLHFQGWQLPTSASQQGQRFY